MSRIYRNEEELSLISGNLAQLYKDGIPINIALELARDVISNKAYKNSLDKVLLSVEEGESLSESFKKFENLYPYFFTGILSIGEKSGKLYEVLNGLRMYYEKVVFIKKEIINASMYPICIFISIIVFGMISLKSIVPNFYDIYNSMNIVPSKFFKYLYQININLNNKPLIMMCFIISWGIVLPIIGIKCLAKNIRIHSFVKISIISCYYEYMMILLLSIIISAGVNIAYALEYCEEGINSYYLKQKISKIKNSILKGNTLYESLEQTGVFSKYVLAIVKIREESGSIEEGFKELYLKSEKSLLKKIHKYLLHIQPTLIVFMGILILIFLMVFILPLFDNLKIGIR